MNTDISLLQEGIVTVKVKFPANGGLGKDHMFEGKEYLYKTNLTLEEGNKVIVKVRNSGAFKVCLVTEVHDFVDTESYGKDLTWIVQKVDESMFEELVTVDREMRKAIQQLETTQRKKELQASMEESIGKIGLRKLTELGKRFSNIMLITKA